VSKTATAKKTAASKPVAADSVSPTYTTVVRWCSSCSRTTSRKVLSSDDNHGDKFWPHTVRLASRCSVCQNEVIDFHSDKDITNMLATGLLVAKTPKGEEE